MEIVLINEYMNLCFYCTSILHTWFLATGTFYTMAYSDFFSSNASRICLV